MENRMRRQLKEHEAKSSREHRAIGCYRRVRKIKGTPKISEGSQQPSGSWDRKQNGPENDTTREK